MNPSFSRALKQNCPQACRLCPQKNVTWKFHASNKDGVCADNLDFIDAWGETCRHYAIIGCGNFDGRSILKQKSEAHVKVIEENCPQSCGLCAMAGPDWAYSAPEMGLNPEVCLLRHLLNSGPIPYLCSIFSPVVPNPDNVVCLLHL